MMAKWFKSHIEGTPEALKWLRDSIDEALNNGERKVLIYSNLDGYFTIKLTDPLILNNMLNNQWSCFQQQYANPLVFA